ncbi:MAG: hypothetical protein WAK18_14685 [Nocardioidaceae bacterium]
MSTTQGPPPAVGIDDAFGRGFAAARRELGDLVDTPTWSLDESSTGVMSALRSIR